MLEGGKAWVMASTCETIGEAHRQLQKGAKLVKLYGTPHTVAFIYQTDSSPARSLCLSLSTLPTPNN